MTTIEQRAVYLQQLKRGETIGTPEFTEIMRKRLVDAGESVPEATVERRTASQLIAARQARKFSARSDPKKFRDVR